MEREVEQMLYFEAKNKKKQKKKQKNKKTKSTGKKLKTQGILPWLECGHPD